MRETHLPLMSRGGWIFLKQHLAWQITLEKQTFAKAAEATHKLGWDQCWRSIQTLIYLPFHEFFDCKILKFAVLEISNLFMLVANQNRKMSKTFYFVEFSLASTNLFFFWEMSYFVFLRLTLSNCVQSCSELYFLAKSWLTPNLVVLGKEFFRTCNVLPFSCTHLALWVRQGKRPKVHAKQKGFKNFFRTHGISKILFI